MKLDKKTAEKMKDIDDTIYKRVNELKRWKKAIDPKKLGKPFTKLFDFVLDDVKVRRDITKGDKIFLDPDEETIEKVKKLRSETSELINKKIADLHDDVSFQIVRDVVKTIEENEESEKYKKKGETPLVKTSEDDMPSYKLKL